MVFDLNDILNTLFLLKLEEKTTLNVDTFMVWFLLISESPWYIDTESKNTTYTTKL